MSRRARDGQAGRALGGPGRLVGASPGLRARTSRCEQSSSGRRPNVSGWVRTTSACRPIASHSKINESTSSSPARSRRHADVEAEVLRWAAKRRAARWVLPVGSSRRWPGLPRACSPPTRPWRGRANQSRGRSRRDRLASGGQGVAVGLRRQRSPSPVGRGTRPPPGCCDGPMASMWAIRPTRRGCRRLQPGRPVRRWASLGRP